MFRTALAFAVLLSPLAACSTELFMLSDACPASHVKRQDGKCELVTLYDFYDSQPEHGGVQARLPKRKNFYTPEQIDLGRYLFFDPILSVNRDMSCASCHRMDRSLSDGRRRSLGAGPHGNRIELQRSTPSLWNVGLQDRFMWDGRADTLEAQSELPLFSEMEMGNSPAQLEADLQANSVYAALFDQVYQSVPTVENISRSLAAFQSTLVSFNSRYDRYAHGDSSALNSQEIRGFNAFRGFVGRCSQCHVPPLFSDNELSVVGAPANDLGYSDPGAAVINDDPSYVGAFKVPTLRNIAHTAPYFHSGQFANLLEVVEFYNNTRGHMAPPQQDLKIHWHVHMTEGPQLSGKDMEDIVAFLGALSDESLTPKAPERVPSGIKVVAKLDGGQDEKSPR